MGVGKVGVRVGRWGGGEKGEGRHNRQELRATLPPISLRELGKKAGIRTRENETHETVTNVCKQRKLTKNSKKKKTKARDDIYE